jgi:hypothetical protein
MKIDDSVEVFEEHPLKGLESLTKVRFSFCNHLRKIDGFVECPRLYEIEIPSSVEVIGWSGFKGCVSLKEVIFFIGQSFEMDWRVY